MSWRVVSIAKQSYLSVRHESLVIKQDGEEVTLPLEDMGVLLLESHQTTISAALLNACIQHKIAVLLCDEKHLPSGVLQAYQQHSRQRSVIDAQLAMTEPFKKRLRQAIVIQKIKNQASVCDMLLGGHPSEFEYYVKTVHSGDLLNREASAAKLYFSLLLPKGVLRGTEHVLNAALNYGYAVVRGAVARSLASYGFLTSKGFMHISDVNNFALADDIMEPYRPFVDKVVFDRVNKDSDKLTKQDRDNILHVLTTEVRLNGKSYALLRAIELTVQSLVSAIANKSPNELVLPHIV